jgi:divalent metal cation (Fe/Co/Zn/Cd) transporter
MDRTTDLRRAIELSALSIALSGLFGAAAVIVAIATGRLSLLGFGFDAVMDSIASCVLIWRFRIEHSAPGRARSVERAAEIVVGVVLVVLAVVLAAGAVAALTGGRHAESSVVGLAISVASVVLLPPLALAKRRAAERLGSRALRADAILTGIAAAIAGLSVIGFVLTETFGIGVADPIGALVVSAVLAREGVGAVRGEPEDGDG